MNRGRGGVHRIPDVFQQNGVQRRARERENGFGNTGTRRLDGDVVVFLKVDPGVLLGGVGGVAEELLFHAYVAAADDVLAVFPGTVAE